MKRFSEQLQKKAQTVKLKKSEQADLRERLVSYMEYHPLPAHLQTAKTVKPATRRSALTESFAQYAIPYQMLFKFGSVAAVFVVLIVPFMAERTVPGDTLYAVKVQFNEEVRGTLTWGSYEKVEWETTRLNRRIAEARLLADEGLLTEEVEAEVAAAVKQHSNNAMREIEALRSSDADQATIASIAFDSSLQMQAMALQGSDDGQNQSNGQTANAGNLVSDVIGASLVNQPSNSVATVPAYDKLMARVEINTTRVRELRDSLDGSVSPQAIADVTRRIEDIDRAIGAAVELQADEATEMAARTALVDVLTRTQKLVVFMTDLEVREQVAIESFVPVVLTPEEITIERSVKTEQLTNDIAKISAAVTELEPALQTKIRSSLATLETGLTTLPEIVAYPAFVAETNRLIALTKDALLLIEQAGTSIGVAPVTTATLTTDIATSTVGVAEVATSSEPVATTDRATSTSN